MKKIASLIVAVAMLASVSVANAADNMWYTLISSSDASVVVADSGPGKALSLTKPGAGAATIRVGLNMTSSTAAFAGWEINHIITGGATFANGALLGTNYDQVLSDITNGSTNATFGRGSSSVSGSAGLVFAFDLVLPAGGNLPVLVTGDFGQSGALYSNGLYWYGRVAANPISFGGAGYTGGADTTPGWGSLPVISIQVPEPTTLVLLGLGAVALLRRRK